MVSEIVMPKLGLTMKEGVIVEWLKKEGESVEKGEPLFVIETEKVQTTIESSASGILKKIVEPVGAVIPVAGVIAYIGEMGEEVHIAKTSDTKREISEQQKAVEAPRAEKPEAEAEVKISPLARKLSQEYNIDISKITGSGPNGRIVKDDILQAKKLQESTALPLEPRIMETREMSTIRRLTAERLSQLHSQTPHVTISTNIDLDRIVKAREELRGKDLERLSYTDLFVKAVALALKDNRVLNAKLGDSKILILENINIGVAVATEKGLVVPVIHEADKKPLSEITRRRIEIVDRARSDKLSMDDIQGGTFTLSNMSMMEVDIFSPMINPPECAILGVGKISNRPWVVENKIEIRPIACFSLTFDHRIADGADAAKFMKKLADLLSDPAQVTHP
ncbi:dihydrolipoamide acetyltransferase family protein [[Eubacterium] cellulosolvens]